MDAARNLILVCAGSEATARDIKDLLEFMEAEQVEIVEVGSWREQLKDRQLSAVFAGPDLEPDARERLLREIGAFDPSVSIVVVDPGDDSAKVAAA